MEGRSVFECGGVHGGVLVDAKCRTGDASSPEN